MCLFLAMGLPLSIVVPKVRQPRSADALFGLVRNGLAPIPDDRRSETALP
jgi:hypothetical protein